MSCCRCCSVALALVLVSMGVQLLFEVHLVVSWVQRSIALSLSLLLEAVLAFWNRAAPVWNPVSLVQMVVEALPGPRELVEEVVSAKLVSFQFVLAHKEALSPACFQA